MGEDLNVSLIADKFFGRPGIIIEVANGNRDGRDDQGRNRQFLEQSLKNISGGASAIQDLGHQGNHPLSFISDK